MPADLFERRTAVPSAGVPPVLDPAFAGRARLARLRDALARAAKRLRPARWNEPVVFFFDLKRQAELEAARAAPADRFAELSGLVAAEMPALQATVEVRRIARVTEGLLDAARALAPHCLAVRELVELLAVPDDEVFLALAPGTRTGVRLFLRGAADVAQLYRLLPHELNSNTAREGTGFQLFLPTALQADGTLPTGFAGCKHWLWPTQPLAMVPRINGERVILVGPAVLGAALEPEPRFPALAVEAEVVETLNSFRTAEALTRLCGRPIAVSPPVETPSVARAA